MLLRLFKSKQPVLLFLVPVIALALWLKTIIITSHSTLQPKASQLPLSNLLNFLFQYNLHLITIVSLIFIVLLGYLLIKLNSEFINIDARVSLPALFYLLIIGNNIELQLKSDMVFPTIFLSLSLIQVFRTYKLEYAFSYLFNAGFFMAVGSLFYAKIIFFFPILWIGVGIIRTYNWREWSVMLVGFLIPFLIASSYFYISDELAMYSKGFADDLFYRNAVFQIKLPDIIFFSYLFIISLVSILYFFMGYDVKKISTRNNLLILFWFVILSLIIFFALQTNSFELLYFLSIPLSIFFTNYFMTERDSWIKEVLFTIFLAITVYSQIID